VLTYIFVAAFVGIVILCTSSVLLFLKVIPSSKINIVTLLRLAKYFYSLLPFVYVQLFITRSVLLLWYPVHYCFRQTNMSSSLWLLIVKVAIWQTCMCPKESWERYIILHYVCFVLSQHRVNALKEIVKYTSHGAYNDNALKFFRNYGILSVLLLFNDWSNIRSFGKFVKCASCHSIT